VTLHLDPKQMSQSIMLDCFDNNQLYEGETSQLLATVLRPGDTFLDVGAHVGYFSMLAGALVGPGGKVVSFEPEERNYRQLLDHVEINDLRHVTPVNAAVAHEDGVADFHVNSDNDGGHALWNVGEHQFNQQSRETPLTRQIDVVSVDRFLRENGISAPRVIKIDAEGSEHAVLLGARETLRSSPAAFVIAEINHFGLERMGTSERAIRDTMTELGYETYAFDPNGQRIVRLGDEDYIQSEYVFNLVFRHPAAA
jgi:FkbM family methyltransferase